MAERVRTQKLTGRLGVGNAPALHRRLSKAVAAGNLRIDASALESADTAIVQIVVAAFASAQVAGHGLTLLAPADGALSAAFAQLGLDDPADATVVRDGDVITAIQASSRRSAA